MRNDDSGDGVWGGSDDSELIYRPEDVSQTRGTAKSSTSADVRDPPVDKPRRKKNGNLVDSRIIQHTELIK